MSLASVRAALAAAALDLSAGPRASPHLGPITLHPHQRLAVARLGRALDTHRGALLADAVGLGKTWVALALVRDALRCGAEPPLVIAPAALRTMWRDAAATAGVAIMLRTTESLSAAAPPGPTRAGLVVVDEAHHFRTPGTRRHERLVALCAHARTLLLSATPIHNAPRAPASSPSACPAGTRRPAPVLRCSSPRSAATSTPSIRPRSPT